MLHFVNMVYNMLYIPIPDQVVDNFVIFYCHKNKLDLYSYLVQRAYKLRMKQLGNLLQNRSLDFFDILRENFRNKVIFDTRHPLESILLFNLFHEADSEEVKHLYKELKSDKLNLTKELIIQFQQKVD